MQFFTKFLTVKKISEPNFLKLSLKAFVDQNNLITKRPLRRHFQKGNFFELFLLQLLIFNWNWNRNCQRAFIEACRVSNTNKNFFVIPSLISFPSFFLALYVTCDYGWLAWIRVFCLCVKKFLCDPLTTFLNSNTIMRKKSWEWVSPLRLRFDFLFGYFSFI